MPNPFFGGCTSVKVDAVGGDFTTPLMTLTEFAEGSTWPNPSQKTDGLANSQQGPTGEICPFEVRAQKADAAEAEVVRLRGFALDRVDVQFVSADGAVTMVVKNVVPRIATMAVAEDGKYGYTVFAGEGSSAGSDRAYAVVQT